MDYPNIISIPVAKYEELVKKEHDLEIIKNIIDNSESYSIKSNINKYIYGQKGDEK